MTLKTRISQAIEALRGKGASIQNVTHDSATGVYGSELYSWLTGGLASSGVVVSEKAALSVSAVYACVGLIGGAIAALPFHIYKRTQSGRERYETDLWWLFNESPAPSWTAASSWQFTAQSILLKGDSFWRIVRASRLSPVIVGFEPIHPDFVVVEQENGRNIYVVTKDGVATAYDQDDMLHFPGLGFDGKRSMTPISYSLRNAAGIAIAADEHAAKFFRGGAKPDQAIVIPPEVKLTQEQKQAISDSWASQRGNYSGNGKTPVLSGGMKIEQLSLNAEDAQLLETRQFGVEEIARAFGVPPHMIGKTDASTSWGSGIEQMSIGFVRYTLRRHLDAIQQEINRKVWPRSLRVFGEFNADALLEGDSKSQVEYFTKALGGPGSQGFMTINEVRKLKNLPPIEGGDEVIKAGVQPAEKQQAQAIAELGRKVEAFAQRPAEQPVINVSPSMHIQSESITNAMEETMQKALSDLNGMAKETLNTIREEVQNMPVVIPAPVVNMEAVINVEKPEPAQVHIAPQVINVAPTPVEVILPARRTETEIERDGNGNIVRATQVEKDI